MQPVRGLFGLLCAFGMLAHAAERTEQPRRQYVLELQTLNNPDRVRRGRAPFSGAAIEFNIASAITDDELEAVKDILDELQASPTDEAGYRHFSIANGTEVRVGGFAEDPEIAGGAVDILPVELSVDGEFSGAEAALILRLATAGNLFVSGADDPESVATTTEVADKRFRKRHKTVAVTPDENALAQWVRQNVEPRSL